jgi:hypothetical protein
MQQLLLLPSSIFANTEPTRAFVQLLWQQRYT